jgi:acetoin utilization deacetylase AcuC-like enzyme
VTSRSLRKACDLTPSHRGRASRVYALVRALGLAERFTVLSAPLATPEDLLRFHSREYLALLRSVDAEPQSRSEEEECACLAGADDGSDSDDDDDGSDDDDESKLALYGLEGDCEPYVGVWRQSRAVAGATLFAARRLVIASEERDDARSRWRAAQERLREAGVACAPPDEEEEEEEEESPPRAFPPSSPPPSPLAAVAPPPRAPLAVCWTGGRHHARADRAAGFCFVNDIVLAILEILRSAPTARVLYIDSDVHHGDGVAAAFSSSERVVTLSFHHASRGFFPGTGGVADVGIGRGKHHDINVPLGRGVSDATFDEIFRRATSAVERALRPTHIVWQCGADGLAWDPQGAWNLTPSLWAQLAAHVRAFDVPLLVLGGGGYHVTQTARAWAYATAALVEPGGARGAAPGGEAQPPSPARAGPHQYQCPTGLGPEAEVPEHEYFAEYLGASRSAGELMDEDDEEVGASFGGGRGGGARGGGGSGERGGGRSGAQSSGGFGFMFRTRAASSIVRPDEEADAERIDEIVRVVEASAAKIEQRRLRRG